MAQIKLVRTDDFTGIKTCARCAVERPLTAFNQRTASRDGRHSYCRPCMTSYQREKKYGLTPAEINELLSGGCEVCGSTESLCIDHDHNSNEVRGCLCDWCNRALGLLRDSTEQVRALAEYRARF